MAPRPSGIGDQDAAGIRTSKERVVYENPRVRVRRDDVVFADGLLGDYTVIEKPEFALVIPLDGEQVWLVQQYRYPLGRRTWEFPQGTWPLDRNCAVVRSGRFPGSIRGDIRELAVQELREETGLLAGRLERIGVFCPASGYSPQKVHVFVASDLSAGPTDREDTESDMQARPVPVDEVRSMIATGVIVDICTVAAFGLVLGHLPATSAMPLSG